MPAEISDETLKQLIVAFSGIAVGAAGPLALWWRERSRRASPVTALEAATAFQTAMNIQSTAIVAELRAENTKLEKQVEYQAGKIRGLEQKYESLLSRLAAAGIDTIVPERHGEQADMFYDHLPPQKLL